MRDHRGEFFDHHVLVGDVDFEGVEAGGVLGHMRVMARCGTGGKERGGQRTGGELVTVWFFHDRISSLGKQRAQGLQGNRGVHRQL